VSRKAGPFWLHGSLRRLRRRAGAVCADSLCERVRASAERFSDGTALSHRYLPTAMRDRWANPQAGNSAVLLRSGGTDGRSGVAQGRAVIGID